MKLRPVLFLLVLAAITVVGIVNAAPEFTSFAAFIAFAALGLALLRFADVYMLPGFDLIEDVIKKSPVAAAIVFLGICQIIASAIAAS